MTVAGQRYGGRPVPLFIDPDPDLTPNWRRHAACRGINTEVFFVHPNNDDGIATAKWWCHRCPVRDDCLAWALAADVTYGVYGGLTPTERRKVGAT